MSLASASASDSHLSSTLCAPLMDHGSWSENARLEIPRNFRTFTELRVLEPGKTWNCPSKFVSSDTRPGPEDTEEATPASGHLSPEGRASSDWRDVLSVAPSEQCGDW